MTGPVILDTGPLVAFLNRRDHYHDWTVRQWGAIRPPMLTCEAVLAEACFLVRQLHDGPEAVMELLRRGVIKVSFNLSSECEYIARLLKRYGDVPISLADACLVRMAETHAHGKVLSLDADFSIYRTMDRRVIPVLMPGVVGA